MKKILILIVSLFLLTGCDTLMNTPTKRVENLLSKYQQQDSEVLTQLDNTLGIIDSDYFFSDNEGHIMLKITNDSKSFKTLDIKEGDAIAQGIFLPYGIAVDDEADGIRNGGFGSTDRK